MVVSGRLREEAARRVFTGPAGYAVHSVLGQHGESGASAWTGHE